MGQYIGKSWTFFGVQDLKDSMDLWIFWKISGLEAKKPRTVVCKMNMSCCNQTMNMNNAAIVFGFNGQMKWSAIGMEMECKWSAMEMDGNGMELKWNGN